MSFTQIPDLLIDAKNLDCFELAAAVVIARKTIGWGKTSDGISLTQFMEHMKVSKPTAIKAIAGLINKRVVEKTYSFKDNGGQSFNKYSFTKSFVDAANDENQSTFDAISDAGISNNTERTDGFIYFVSEKSNGHTKIGKTIDMTNRMKTFSVKLPFKIDVLHSFKCRDYSLSERKLHSFFEEKRADGEWFLLDEKDIQLVNDNLFLKSLGIEVIK